MTGKSNSASGRIFAAIGVTYPAGAELTCSDGEITLRANAGLSRWIFALPRAGSWTLSLSNGTDSKSQTVEITAQGQFEDITLSYGLVLYEAGSFATGYSALSKDDNSSASSVTNQSDYMLWECGTNAYCMFYISPKLSCAGYKTLSISLSNASMTIDSDEAGKGKWGLSTSTDVEGGGFVASQSFSKFSGSKTLSLDVSALSDTAYYVALQFGTPATGGSFSARVTKIWLE